LKQTGCRGVRFLGASSATTEGRFKIFLVEVHLADGHIPGHHFGEEYAAEIEIERIHG